MARSTRRGSSAGERRRGQGPPAGGAARRGGDPQPERGAGRGGDHRHAHEPGPGREEDGHERAGGPEGSHHPGHGHGHGHGDGHGGRDRLGNPQDLAAYLERLEGEDRITWQKPDEVIRLLGVKRGDRVCDVGVGPGYFALRLARAVG
ncbi:MAG TPA: hypothetical protein VEP68_04940, partial [Anaeromyxobacteraceae bacterium]|nr:hypothetical protein [Anaeromyxobacteraceae bacterium]